MNTSTLENWLDTATKGFFPNTQVRLRAEYTAGYHDAQDAGETDILSQWGDPRQVNRELRRTYLTTEDTLFLQAVFPSKRQPEAPECLLQRLWQGMALLGVTLLALGRIPWLVSMEATTYWIVSGSGFMFLLLALDTRQSWQKAKTTFPPG